VLFKIGQVNVFAGEVWYYPEGSDWRMSQGAIQVIYNVCATLVSQDYYHQAKVSGTHFAVEGFLDCCIVE
jgi:hypothetical protein